MIILSVQEIYQVTGGKFINTDGIHGDKKNYKCCCLYCDSIPCHISCGFWGWAANATDCAEDVCKTFSPCDSCTPYLRS